MNKENNTTFVIVNGKVTLSHEYDLIKRILKEGYKFIEKEYRIKIKKEEKQVSIGSCSVKQVIN